MSHYTVLVVTKDGDYESALAPFDERIEVEPYVRETKEELIKKEKERFKNYLERVTKGEDVSSFEEDHPATLDWNDDEAILKNYIENNKEWEEFDKEGNRLSTYNPQSKWDWYSLGGRWGGSFRLKEGGEVIKESELTWATGYAPVENGYTDHAQFKDIDLTPDSKEIKKAERFWEVVVEGKPKEEGEKAEDFETFWKKEYYTEQYGDKATYVKCQTELFACALLYHGEWIEAGQMGWFGCKDSTSDSEKAYREKFYEIVNNLDPDDYLSMIDCHI